MMRHTTECLHQTLPKSYKQAVALLMKAAPEVKGFEAMCLPDYIELYGPDDWDLSLEALACFTKYSSSEFAIRPYIKEDAKRAMAFMEKLADDPDPKVRRFASEGCRPRLPWAMGLPQFKIVYFAKPGGKAGKKVFQITEDTYQHGEHAFTRKHAFADMSTRKHHSGKHEIEIVVNGVAKAKATFRLVSA